MNKFKSVGIPRLREDIAALKYKESEERIRQTYWALRRSDELIIQSKQVISRARKQLRKDDK